MQRVRAPADAGEQAPVAEMSAGEPSGGGDSATEATLAMDVPSGSYVPDAGHSYITATYSHLGFSYPHVGFNDFDIALEFDAEDVTASSLTVSVDVAAVDSRDEKFDEHLRSDEIFDSESFPAMTFASTAIEAVGGNKLEVTGDLTIRDVTRPVVLDVTINKAASHPMKNVPTIGASAEATLKRSDWGVDYAVPAVGDEVTIYIETELLHQADAPDT